MRDHVHRVRTAAEFRELAGGESRDATELWVGFYKKGVAKTSMTYKESVEEGLCFGWIDGITRRIDDEVYAIRFTPRRKRSNWSAINIARMAELIAAGRMHPAGIRAFEARDGGEPRHLLLRESARGPAGRLSGAPEGERRGLELVAGTATGISARRDLVGRIGQAAGDTRSAARDADRRLCGRAQDQVAAVRQAKERRPMTGGSHMSIVIDDDRKTLGVVQATTTVSPFPLGRGRSRTMLPAKSRRQPSRESGLEDGTEGTWRTRCTRSHLDRAAAPNGADGLVELHATRRPPARGAVWFNWDGRVFDLFSKPNAQKVRNLREHPEVMLAVGQPNEEFDVELVEGRAAIIARPTAEVIPPTMFEKYADLMTRAALDTIPSSARIRSRSGSPPTRFLGYGGKGWTDPALTRTATRTSRATSASPASGRSWTDAQQAMLSPRSPALPGSPDAARNSSPSRTRYAPASRPSPAPRVYSAEELKLCRGPPVLRVKSPLSSMLSFALDPPHGQTGWMNIQRWPSSLPRGKGARTARPGSPTAVARPPPAPRA